MSRLYARFIAGFTLLGLFTLGLGCQTANSEKSPDKSEELSPALQRIHAELARAAEIEANGGEILNVGFVMLETVFNSELMAPYDIFQHTLFRDDQNYMQPFIVAPSMKPVTTFEGIEVAPHFTFETTPEIDVLIVPSTNNSMSSDLENEEFMNWLTETAQKARYVITVCDGAFPLAATGLLNGKVATTFPGDREKFAEMFPEIDVRFDQNFVVDGKYITSVGGAMSYEPALYLVEHIYSKTHADQIAEGMVWPWNLSEVPHLIVQE